MCAQCREVLDCEATAQSQLNQFRVVASGPPSPSCPSEQKLQQCAAGVLGQEETVQLLQHAATCKHCDPLLKSAIALFSDETTQEEKDTVSQLAASAPSWQRDLATRLDRIGHEE